MIFGSPRPSASIIPPTSSTINLLFIIDLAHPFAQTHAPDLGLCLAEGRPGSCNPPFGAAGGREPAAPAAGAWWRCRSGSWRYTPIFVMLVDVDTYT